MYYVQFSEFRSVDCRSMRLRFTHVYQCVLMCTNVYRRVRKCTNCKISTRNYMKSRLHKLIHEYQIGQKGVPKCTNVYQSVQMCTEVYKSVQKCTNVNKSVKTSTKVYKPSEVTVRCFRRLMAYVLGGK